MTFTLKLAQADWSSSGGPYTWRWMKPGSSNGEQLTGPARFNYGDGGYLEDDNWIDVRTGGDGTFQIWIGDHKTIPSNLETEVEIETHAATMLEQWIAGVTQVVSLGSVDPSRKALLDVVQGNDPRFAMHCGPGDGIEIHTWMGPEKKTVRKVLIVNFASGPSRVMLVERAWLLGPDGCTIDKLAP